MPIEIERKFLVHGTDWRRAAVRRERLRQGYLATAPKSVVRVRISDPGGATLAVKGPRQGLARWEFEYPVPVEHAEEMLRLCVSPPLEKVRHWVEHAGSVWHVDVYDGAAAGLVVAEIELERPGQTFVRPPWLGREVTGDPAYSNSAIWEGSPGPAPSRPVPRAATGRPPIHTPRLRLLTASPAPSGRG